MSEESVSQQLTSYLERLRGGDDIVLAALWDLVNDRLTALTRRMKRGHYQVVGIWELTEDIAQNARIRLIRAMKTHVPATPREFYGLANLQIRRELIDTIRQHVGRSGERQLFMEMSDDFQVADEQFDPELLGLWLEFHEFVDALPVQEREIVELLWYQGLTQEQAADVLGVDKSTVKRRWREIRPKLAGVLPQDGQLDE